MQKYEVWQATNTFWGECCVKGDDGHVDGLVQERRNASTLTMALRLSCTNPLVYSPTLVSTTSFGEWSSIPIYHWPASHFRKQPFSVLLGRHRRNENQTHRVQESGRWGTGKWCKDVGWISCRCNLQRKKFLQATFSKAVENVLVTNSNNLKAEWSLIHNRYQTVNDAGVPVYQQIAWLPEMRLDYWTNSALESSLHLDPM